MKTQVISFHCVLKDPLGRIISSSFNHDLVASFPETSEPPLPRLPAHTPQPSHFDFHEPLQGLLEGLQGVKKGERRTILVSAEKAYGFYDPDLVMKISRKKLPHGEALEVGFQVISQAKDGECRVFRITQADALSVTLDGNHPLAGQDLRFDIEATSSREATPEEIEQSKLASQAARTLH